MSRAFTISDTQKVLCFMEGDAGEALNDHNGMKFTTKDRDNDISNDNCAVQWKGGWWYEGCYDSNLNGLYLKDYSAQGIIWSFWKEDILKNVEMKMRPALF